MPRLAKQFLTWTVATLGTLGLTYFIFQWMQLAPFMPESTKAIPDITLSQTSLMHYDGNGHKVWTVDANTLSFDEDNQRTLANEVEVSFWSESNTDDAPQLIVITPQLNFSHLNRDLTFENGLEAHSTQGLKFRTDKAQWSDSAQVLEGKGNVRVEQTDALGGTVVLEGDTIRYDTNTGTFLLNADAESDSNVQLRIKPEEAETP